MPNAITTDLSTVISKVTEKATSAESAASQELQLDAQIKTANQRADSATKQLDQASVSKQEAQDKLSPPPMKTEAGEGKKGNSKKVVDENEKNKLEANVRAADAQIQQAQKAVDTARQEAGALTTQKAGMGDLNAQQQSDMTNLTNQLDELKRLAKDPNTDLNGNDYQTKLNGAIESTNTLAGSLPNNGDAKAFWAGVKGSFKELDAAMKEYIDIDAPPIDSANNYASFFSQSNTEFDKVLQSLQGNGDQALVQSVTNAKDSISNESGTYLDGVTDEDKEVMGEMLRQLLVINDKTSQGGSITNEDIAGLIEASSDAAGILNQGGSGAEGVITAPFEGIGMNFEALDARDTDPAIDEFGAKLKQFYDEPTNDIADLKGISKDDMDSIYAYADQVRAAKEKVTGGQQLSSTERTGLIDSGNQFMQMLITRYGLTDGTAGSTNPNSLAANNGLG